MRTKNLKGQLLVCARPQYSLSTLQTDLTRQSFCCVGSDILEAELVHDVDLDGLVWLPAEFSAPKMMDLFQRDPGKFLKASSKRMSAYLEASSLVRRANASLRKGGSTVSQLHDLAASYIVLLKFVTISNLIFDEAYTRLERLVKDLVPPRIAESHLSSLLRCDAVAKAIELEFVEDVRGTKRIEDVSSDPICIFGETSLNVFSPTDDLVNPFLVKETEMFSDYLALRLMIPLMYQFAEEWRYADYSMRTHFHYILDSLSVSYDPYSMSFDELLSDLRSNE